MKLKEINKKLKNMSGPFYNEYGDIVGGIEGNKIYRLPKEQQDLYTTGDKFSRSLQNLFEKSFNLPFFREFHSPQINNKIYGGFQQLPYRANINRVKPKLF